MNGICLSLQALDRSTAWLLLFWFLAFYTSNNFTVSKCRKVAIINLDPANDALPYPVYYQWHNFSIFFLCGSNHGHFILIVNDFLDMNWSYDCAVNIEDLIKLNDVMNEHSLGPNGGQLTFLYFAHSMVWIWSPFWKVYIEQIWNI